jgi:soluble lytic murein transglycosylase-like protein
MMFVLADDASANDDRLCAPSSRLIPQFCPQLPVAAIARRDPPAVAAPATFVDIPRNDVTIDAGVSEAEVVSLAAVEALPTPIEPERAVPQSRSLERVFDQADLRAYARDAALRQGIDPGIFVRQIEAESAFNPNAVSKAGAVGIAQILPSWHPDVDPTDPYASLDYAARLMRGYIVYFGDWRRALVAYNAGPGRLMPGNPHYLPLATLLSNSFGGGETKRYVERILGR